MPSGATIPSVSQIPPQLNVKSRAVGRPRLDSYGRLLSRFYEPLILLFVLGETRGDHTPKKRDRSIRGTRRQFRDDLAFLCEYKKGGDACTAIIVEDRPDSLVYWVAANVNPVNKILPFLRSILQELEIISGLSNEDRQDRVEAFTERCVGFAQEKVKRLKGLLLTGISNTTAKLEMSTSDIDPGLHSWLQRFKEVDDCLDLCKLAYKMRKSDFMKHLKLLSQHPAYQNNTNDKVSPFWQVRHYIGRLADHIRVAKRLIKEVDAVRDLLVNTFYVRPIPIPPCVPPPQVDNHSTLDGICKRMFSNPADPRVPEVKAKLDEMDKKSGLHQDIVTEYNKPSFKPRVHAEIQAVEFAYSHKMEWLDDDRYIACSKPACFCCFLYLRYHPVKPDAPQSHQKVYLNWGPPLLALGARDAGYRHQRDILNKIIADIRENAFEQVLNKQSSHQWHPDSRTGITSTVADLERSFNTARSLDSDSTQGDDESDGDSDLDATDTNDTSLTELSSMSASPPATTGDGENVRASSQSGPDSDSDSDEGALL